jgi:hypothetical protein
MDQLDQIGADLRWSPATDHLALLALADGVDLEGLLKAGFELLVMFHRLPEIPLLGPPPAKWDTSAALDAALVWRRREKAGELLHLERVRALLAKAESTEFDEKAEALTEKAQELMTRYSIDAALLAAHVAGKQYLAERSRLVDDHLDQAFPERCDHGLSVNDWSGWVIGAEAADAAEIARGPLLDKRATA